MPPIGRVEKFGEILALEGIGWAHPWGNLLLALNWWYSMPHWRQNWRFKGWELEGRQSFVKLDEPLEDSSQTPFVAIAEPRTEIAFLLDKGSSLLELDFGGWTILEPSEELTLYLCYLRFVPNFL